MDYTIGQPLPDDYEPDFGDEAPAAPPAVKPVIGQALPDDYQPDFGEDENRPNYASNLVRGMGERASQIMGGGVRAAGAALEYAGDTLENYIPLGRVVRGEDGWSWQPHTPESIAETSELGRSAQDVARGLSDTKFGYDPRTTWEDFKASPLRNFIPFAMEQGLISVPDMIAVVTNLPGYVVSRTGEIGQTRAENDERPDATIEDLVKALPAAATSALLEKIGTEKIFGLGDEALKGLRSLLVASLKAAGTEAVTEAGQEGVEYLGEQLGTAKGVELAEGAERMAAGAVGGAGFGGVVRGVTGAAEIATRRSEEGQSTPGGTGTPATPPSNQSPTVTEEAGKEELGQPTVATPPAAATPGAIPDTGTSVDPDVAAAMPTAPAPNQGVGAADTSAAQPAVAVAGVQNDVQAGAIPDPTDEYDDSEKTVASDSLGSFLDEVDPEQAEAKQRRATTVQVAPANDDVNAALAAAAPAVPTPEIPGTPEAAARRELPPTTETVEPLDAPVDGVSEQSSVVAQPEVPQLPEVVIGQPLPDNYQPDFADDIDMDNFQDPLDVPENDDLVTAQLTNTPPEPVYDPQAVSLVPVEESAPFALSEPLSPTARQAVDEALQRLDEPQFADLASDPQRFRLLEDAARDLAGEPPSQLPRNRVSQWASEQVQEILNRAVDRHTEMTVERAKAQAAEWASADARAKAAQRSRETGPKGKEHLRRSKKREKPADDIFLDSDETLMKRARKELVKPEKERDPDLLSFLRGYDERKKIKGPGAENKVKRSIATRVMDDARERYVNKVREKQSAEAPPKQIKPGLTPEDKALAVRKTDNARARAVNDAVEKSLPSLPEFPTGRLTMADLRQGGRAEQWAKDIASALKKAVIDAAPSSKTLRDNVNRNANGVGENLAIFARDLGKRDYKDKGPADLWLALNFAKEGDLDNLYNLITNEKINAHQLSDSIPDPVNENFLTADEVFQNKTPTFLSDPSNNRGAHTEYVENGPVGNRQMVAIDVQQSMTADDALKDMLKSGALNGRGAFTVFAKMYVKLLRQLVGDVKVNIVTREETAKVQTNFEVAGWVNGLTLQQIADGQKNQVFINIDAVLSDQDAAHTLMHELTHIATKNALSLNTNGAYDVLLSLRDAIVKELELDGSARSEKILSTYGLRGDRVGGSRQGRLTGDLMEFVAEAFTNQEFQNILAGMTVSDAQMKEMVALASGKPNPSWWDAFVGFVNNALFRSGLQTDRGRRTVLEVVLSLQPQLMNTSAEIRPAAQKAIRHNMAVRLFNKRQAQSLENAVTAEHPMDVAAFLSSTMNTAMGVTQKFRLNDLSQFRRKTAAMLATTKGLERHAESLFGGPDNPFSRLTSTFLKADEVRLKHRREGDNIAGQLLRYFAKNPDVERAMNDIVFDATAAEVDPRYDLSHDANKHISKKGVKDTRRRRVHARLRTAYLDLPQEAQDLLDRVVAHQKRQVDKSVELTVKKILTAAMRPREQHGLGVTLPPGETMDSAVKWIMDGHIDRPMAEDPQNPGPNDRTARDQEMHEALGSTAKTLAGTKELRGLKGLYMPLLRNGKYIFTATHKVKVPKGAVLENENELVFRNAKAMQEFLDTTTEDQRGEVQSEWWRKNDAGQWVKTTKMDMVTLKDGTHAIPINIWRVAIQNKSVVMRDSTDELKKIREEYVKNGSFDKISDIDLLEKHVYGATEISSPQIKRLIRNIEQSHGAESKVSQDILVSAVVNAHVRQMGQGRAAHRRLFRKGTLGYERDMATNFLTNNNTMAGHLANLENSVVMDDAMRELQDYGKNRADGKSLERSTLIKELVARIYSLQASNEPWWGKQALQNLVNISFSKFLFSPSYSINNATQPFLVTFPMLASKFGDGAAASEISSALYDLGAGKTVKRGLRETMEEVRHIKDPLGRHQFDYDGDMEAKANSVEPGFKDVVVELRESGFGASGGIESAELLEVNKGKFTKAVTRVTRIARTLPEAVETVNRYVTALAAYRLAKRAGMDQKTAVAYAVNMVEQTQGGYAAANNPRFMNHPLMRIPTQFRKYAVMYGNLYYNAIMRMIRPGDRKLAAKELARLSAMSVVAAGIAGLPLMELAFVLSLVAYGMGLSDNDWEDWENGMQSFFNAILGNYVSEKLVRGLPRAIGIDTSQRLGNDQIFLNGRPWNYEEEGIKFWLLEQIVGASGSMSDQTFEWWQSDDKWGKDIGKLPLPKFATDLAKAWNSDTWGQTVAQSIGYSPASKAQEYEPGGAKFDKQQQYKLKQERNRIFARWYKLSGRERQEYTRTVIAKWNKENPDKSLRIDYADLLKSKRRRDAEARKQEN